jgi:hypothetical protein
MQTNEVNLQFDFDCKFVFLELFQCLRLSILIRQLQNEEEIGLK